MFQHHPVLTTRPNCDSQARYLGPHDYPDWPQNFSYSADTLGRPTGITASPLNPGDTPRQVVKDVLYGPAGELQQLRVFQDPAPGSTSAYVKQTFSYNNLLQMTQQTAIDEQSGGATTTLLNLEYRYTEGQNNGRITQLKDWVSGEEVSYSYDALNRLIQASTTGPEYGLNFAYDGFGNLTSQQLFKGTGYNTNLSYDGQTNRITTPGYAYDANGNLIAMPAMTMSYNVLNRMTQSVQTTSGTKLYAYSANGQRVAQSDPPHSNYWNNTWSIYFYGPDGHRIADCSAGYDQARAFTATCGTAYIYFGGKLVRKEQKPVQQEDGTWVYPPGTTLASDRLGSTRYAGGTTTSYYPYGEERTPTANDTQKFATYTRDSATGLDYANARYYSPQIARFTTADPYQASGAPADPQSWNRYSYVQNDPINFGDPSGMDECAAQYGTPCFSTTGKAETPGDPTTTNPTAWGASVFGGDYGVPEVVPVNTEGGGYVAPLGPDDPIARALSLLPSALARAVQALTLNASCMNLFGNERTRQANFDPVVVLTALLTGNSTLTGRYFGGTDFNYHGNGAAITRPAAGTRLSLSPPFVKSDTVTISINTEYWNIGNTDYNAELLLEELGHAYNFLRGSGNSRVRNIGEAFNSNVNEAIIKRNCFPENP